MIADMTYVQITLLMLTWMILCVSIFCYIAYRLAKKQNTTAMAIATFVALPVILLPIFIASNKRQSILAEKRVTTMSELTGLNIKSVNKEETKAKIDCGGEIETYPVIRWRGNNYPYDDQGFNIVLINSTTIVNQACLLP